MEKGKWVRVMEEQVGVVIGDLVVLPVRSGRNLKPRGQQINQVDYGSEEEPIAFPINYNGERACEENVISVKITGTKTSMLVYSGAQSTVSGLRGNLIPEERNLRVYQYGNGCLTRWSVNLKLQLSVLGKK